MPLQSVPLFSFSIIGRPGVEKFLAHDKLLYNAERKTQYLKNDTLCIGVVKVTLNKN